VVSVSLKPHTLVSSNSTFSCYTDSERSLGLVFVLPVLRRIASRRLRRRAPTESVGKLLGRGRRATHRV